MVRTIFAAALAFFAMALLTLPLPALAIPSGPSESPLQAVDQLNDAQVQSLEAFIERNATSAPGSTELKWTAKGGAISAIVTFEGAPPTSRGVGSAGCRRGMLKFQPSEIGVYITEVCISTAMDYKVISALTRVKRAETAAPSKPVKREETEFTPAPPPPPQPSPIVEGPPPTSAEPAPVREPATSTDDGIVSGGAPGGAASGPNTTAGTSGAGGGIERTLTAVLVEIGPVQPRLARHGGSAVVLLSENVADNTKNMTLCKALFRAFDTATISEISVGERTTEEGDIEELRPLYWLLKDVTPPPASTDKCQNRVAKYDFARAWKIRSKMSLTGRGPYLLISRADERRAGLVDLTGVSNAEVEEMVRYFRDGFSQEDDIWNEERHTPERARIAMESFFGHAVQLTSLPRLVTANVSRAGCSLGELLDLCGNPLPH